MIKNIEIKARCTDLERIRQILIGLDSNCLGIDHQIDTYFRVPEGRLKLRQGNIENALIYYRRPDMPGPKLSDVLLHPTSDGASLAALLETSLGVIAKVDKLREIHFIGNVKFHLDEVKGLGSFIEIEAIDRDGSLDTDHLLAQCHHYLGLFGVDPADLLHDSYSDQLIKAGG